jgi:hypothetical protein
MILHCFGLSLEVSYKPTFRPRGGPHFMAWSVGKSGCGVKQEFRIKSEGGPAETFLKAVPSLAGP